MKTLRIFLLVSIGLFSAVLSFAQTVDEILAKHVEAAGGEAAWRKINSMKIEGTVNVQGTDILIVITQLHNKGRRNDVTVMGMTGYQILTTEKGWSYMPFQGQTEPTETKKEDVIADQAELDIQGSILDYKSKGHTIELAGKETVDGKELFKINLTYKSGKKATLFLDPANYHIVKSITTDKVNGQEQEVVTLYSNFEKVDGGIVLAKTIDLPYGRMTVNKVEVNLPVDENIFKPEK